MSDFNRVVNVSKDFYVELANALLPTERWYDGDGKGYVLYAVDHETGQTTRITFHAVTSAIPNQPPMPLWKRFLDKLR